MGADDTVWGIESARIDPVHDKFYVWYVRDVRDVREP
jgi:hypothetical protein